MKKRRKSDKEKLGQSLSELDSLWIVGKRYVISSDIDAKNDQQSTTKVSNEMPELPKPSHYTSHQASIALATSRPGNSPSV